MSTQWFTEIIIAASVAGIGLGGLIVTGYLRLVNWYEQREHLRQVEEMELDMKRRLVVDFPERPRIARDLSDERRWG